ncbi:GNAT family N-acetyltransferase [Jongsikchunia kroppenstedtii]|uniref:GNAT family N-acetyltransferase n=1 Tax=Jongsikchunia kroppenstedtii TaxID=1121721 RepID=UPI00037434A5|nr:N-acetyltransferase [Jongsikchunia kroppenstedtii]
MLIRRGTPADHAAIADVHRDAFADLQPPGAESVGEVDLVAALRDSDAWLPELALVADVDGRVVGHICLTRAQLTPVDADSVPVLALGPVGVLSGEQRGGVGSALIHAALGGADALGERLVGLVGHDEYYPRFGFRRGASVGIEPDVADWAAHFQVRRLDADTGLLGVFRYAPPFYA